MTASRVKPEATYLILGSPALAGRHRPDELMNVFTNEAAARGAFQDLRREVGSGSGWAELVVVEEGVVRPLCWFGLPPADGRACVAPAPETRRPTARWVCGVLAVAAGAALWLFAGSAGRVGAAVAPHVTKTGLITVTDGQRAEATVTNDSDACHRIEIALIDGDGHPVASDARTVCPSQHLTVGHSPNGKLRLRSVVALYGVAESIVQPFNLRGSDGWAHRKRRLGAMAEIESRVFGRQSALDFFWRTTPPTCRPATPATSRPPP